jgi:hypothetical protein
VGAGVTACSGGGWHGGPLQGGRMHTFLPESQTKVQVLDMTASATQCICLYNPTVYPYSLQGCATWVDQQPSHPNHAPVQHRCHWRLLLSLIAPLPRPVPVSYFMGPAAQLSCFALGHGSWALNSPTCNLPEVKACSPLSRRALSQGLVSS